MTAQHADFLFKLRSNLTLDRDVALARLEIETLLGSTVTPVPDAAGLEAHPFVSAFAGRADPRADLRKNGVPAFVGSGDVARLGDLIRRAAFLQGVYLRTRATPLAWEAVSRVRDQCGPVLVSKTIGEDLFVFGLPHYLLIEIAEVVARRAPSVHEIAPELTTIRETLLGHREDPAVSRLVPDVLTPRPVTSQLTHDLHYYKAKFFPRLARSLLNVCASRVGWETPRVLDNFVGSGTTLVEASVLGMPSLGVDVDPLAIRIARAKIATLTVERAALEAALDRITGRLAGSRTSQTDPTPWTTFFPRWLLKNRRMPPHVAADLFTQMRRVQDAVADVDPAVAEIVAVLFSDALTRKVRFRFLGTGVGRFSLTIASTSLEQLFLRALHRAIRVAEALAWLRSALRWRLAESEAVIGDARSLPAGIGPFDVLVTSPPYLPASSGRESYTRARALSLLALRMASADDVETLADSAVGAMGAEAIPLDDLSGRERDVVAWLQRDPQRAVKALPTARYFLDMRRALAAMFAVLRPGAKAVVVSGKQSTFYRFATRESLYVVPAAELLAEEAERVGFQVERLLDVQLAKANRNARPRSLDAYYETLIFLYKPDGC